MDSAFDRCMWRLLADNLPDRAGKVVAIDRNRRVTYAELVAEAGRVADWLVARGIRPGDRVIVHLRKCIDEVAAMFGAWKMGAVVVNVNFRWTAAQLAYVARNCRARAVIGPRNALERLTGEHALPEGTAYLVQGKAAGLAQGADPWAELPADSGSAPDECDPHGLAMIIYTSGSTGAPKGAVSTPRAIVSGAMNYLVQGDAMLQLAQATATVANNGVMYRPHLVKYITDSKTGERTMIEPEPLRRLPWKQQNIDTIKKAMVGVNTEGTGARAFAGAEYVSGGKTGTAQVFSLRGAEYKASRLNKNLHDHGLFVAFAPADDPKIALAVLVENGGFGAQAAAPIARMVIDYYLLGKRPKGPATDDDTPEEER